MKKVKNIHIFGPQGSGKDTQSQRLTQKRKVPFIAMGELFRQEVRKKTKIGKEIDSLMKKGKLVSDEITINLLKRRLNKKDVQNGYILNGFPRNFNQLRAMDKIGRIDLVLELKISDKEALRRISGRRICRWCGSTFHILYNPPKKKGICNKCKKRLFIRNDDKPAMIKNRLKIYHQETEPLFDYYKNKGIYLEINGEPPIPAVFKEVVRKIRKFEK